MKRVTAIVRPEKMEPLKDALFAADVKGMTAAPSTAGASTCAAPK